MTPLDARTLESMRKLAALMYYTSEQNEWRDTLRTFLAAHDASTAASRDEELAKVMMQAYMTAQGHGRGVWDALAEKSKQSYIAEARAARAHIAKEQQ